MRNDEHRAGRLFPEAEYYFHLVPVDQEDHVNHLMLRGVLGACPFVAVTEGLFWYIFDSLRWVPPRSGTWQDAPVRFPVIDRNGGPTARSVFAAWLAVFRNAPEQVELTGRWGWTGDDPRGGHYETVRLSRADVEKVFEALVSFAKAAAAGTSLIYGSDFMHDFRRREG